VFTIMAFLTRRTDVGRDDLIAHYEGHHVPLVLSLAPPPSSYRRDYPVDDATGPAGRPDVITTLTFPDRTSYESWVAAMYAPDSGVAADEETFLDRARTTSFVVDERTSG
jgi:hypothetical protein